MSVRPRMESRECRAARLSRASPRLPLPRRTPSGGTPPPGPHTPTGCDSSTGSRASVARSCFQQPLTVGRRDAVPACHVCCGHLGSARSQLQLLLLLDAHTTSRSFQSSSRLHQHRSNQHHELSEATSSCSLRPNTTATEAEAARPGLPLGAGGSDQPYAPTLRVGRCEGRVG
jgi:hypothetical protein